LFSLIFALEAPADILWSMIVEVVDAKLTVRSGLDEPEAALFPAPEEGGRQDALIPNPAGGGLYVLGVANDRADLVGGLPEHFEMPENMGFWHPKHPAEMLELRVPKQPRPSQGRPS
jgi:hypothetical protein